MNLGPRYFVSLDGPKGVGKTTILNTLADSLKPVRVEVLTEKHLDPNRDQLSKRLKAGIQTKEEELEVAQLFAEGRALITCNHIETSNADILVMDRWFPSDAAFRRRLTYAECLALNLNAGVRQPDLVLAMSCPAEISWKRANHRIGGLRSLVIQDFQDHKDSIDRFELVADTHGWAKIDTTPSIETVLKSTLEAIKLRLF